MNARAELRGRRAAASTAATERPVERPPVATSGRSTAAPTSWRAASSPRSVPARPRSRRGARPPRRPARRARRAPASRARRASAAVVTVTQTSEPVSESRPTTSRRRAAERERHDRDARSSASASFASQPSSSRRGSPSATPRRSLSARSAVAYALTAAGSAAAVGGTKRLSPNGRAVSARRASRSARTASDALVAGRQEAEPAGLADRGGERRRRGAARERRLHDRELDLLQNRHTRRQYEAGRQARPV